MRKAKSILRTTGFIFAAAFLASALNASLADSGDIAQKGVAGLLTERIIGASLG